jgi:hypothetical protein
MTNCTSWQRPSPVRFGNRKWGRFTLCPWSWPPLQVQAHAAWLKALVQCLRRLLGGTCGAKNVYSDDVFTITSLCIIVIIWRGISAESSWKYRQLNRSYQIRTVVPVTILTIPHHTNRTVLKKKEVLWSDDWNMLQRVELLPFSINTEISEHVMLKLTVSI